MKFSTIFFDLGSTLLYTKDPWDLIHHNADLALVSFLNKSGIHITLDALTNRHGSFINSYYAQQKATQDYREKTALVFLQEIVERHGYPGIEPKILRLALDEMYTITQRNWYLEDDALSTLSAIRNQGIRMGLISNTSDDMNVQQLIDRWNIRPYMDFVITSAGFGCRKPDGHIFQAALDYFQVDPWESVMVGDSLEADVLGANRKGIFSIYINRRVQTNDADCYDQPKATISSLSQIIEILCNET